MKMTPTRLEGYELLHEGTLALADIEENGIHIDTQYVLKKQKHLTRQIEHARKQLMRTEEVKKWKGIYRGKFNLDSNQQLAKVLFKHLGYKPIVLTAKKKPSVSQEALEQVDSPIVEKVVRLRRLQKAKDTYLENYLRETIDEYLHAFFHLHIARTFRGSSSKINFQNQPVRIPEIKKIVRRAVISRKGHMIVEIDFSGVEVSTAADYHLDPQMIEDIVNPDRDMHRDMAAMCFKLPTQNVTKDARYCGKNKFVFPQFYGDYYGNNARDLWNSISVLKLKTVKGVPMKKHLASKGIKTYQDFEDHIQEVEDYFWNERYPVYRDWKNKHYKEYCKNGYVDLKTGFRCTGFMSRNDAINYPIQGAAFHILLWCLIRLNAWVKKNLIHSKLIGQIHDSVVGDIHPKELARYLKAAHRIMTEEVQRHWTWMIVPMEIEVEATPVDGSWYLKKEIKKQKCQSCYGRWMWELGGDSKLNWECPICGGKQK